MLQSLNSEIQKLKPVKLAQPQQAIPLYDGWYPEIKRFKSAQDVILMNCLILKMDCEEVRTEDLKFLNF